MAATAKVAVFFALLSAVSSEFNSAAAFPSSKDKGCQFELFKRDPPGLDGPTWEIDWNQSFIYNQMFKGKTLDGVNSNPTQVEELQIKVDNNIDKFSLTAEENVRCAIILADKIQRAMIEGKNLTGLDITGNVEIDGLILRGKKIHDLKLNKELNYANAGPMGNVRRTYISGETVEKLFIISINSTENTINADYASNLQFGGENYFGTTIRAKQVAQEIRFVADDSMDDTHIESFHVNQVRVWASNSINNTHINGTKVNYVNFGTRVLNNIIIEGEMLEVINLGADTMDNVVIKAKTLASSSIGAYEAIRNVDITVSDNIFNLSIMKRSSDVQNFTLHGVPLDFEGSYSTMKCSDYLGYPDGDRGQYTVSSSTFNKVAIQCHGVQRLNSSCQCAYGQFGNQRLFISVIGDSEGAKNCSSELCKSKCSGSFMRGTGKCFGRTCCCMF